MRKYKFFIIAGEESGDIIGEALMKELLARFGDNIEFCGIGGERMIVLGLKSIFEMSKISIIGIWEIIIKLPEILSLIRKTVAAAHEFNPDIVIAIDAQEFSKRVLSKLHGFKRVLYVAPSAWAWRGWRAKTVANYADLLLTLFDFEEHFFKRYGVNAHYVGHPLLENKDLTNIQDCNFKAKIAISKDVICLLAGSRSAEISTLLPIFCKAIKIINKNNDFEIVVPTIKKHINSVSGILKQHGVNAIILLEESEKYYAFKTAKFAIAASGTVAFELAITKTPTIIAYKVNSFTAVLVRLFIKTKFVSLPNILANKLIMPELLQSSCTAENIVLEAQNILTSNVQKEELTRLHDNLLGANKSPRKEAVDAILNLLINH